MSQNSTPDDPDQALRDRLADEVAAEAAFEGFGRKALMTAAERLALPRGEADRLFPGGALTVLEYLSTRSDQRMVDPDYPADWHRRELIQYFPKCTEGHARRLHDMAWLPLFDGFYLDSHHSIAWEHPAISGTPWKNAFFLQPLIRSHREFVFDLEGDSVSFLWHIPISDEERAYKQEHGTDALIDRLEAVELPWVFDENDRPSLI